VAAWQAGIVVFPICLDLLKRYFLWTQQPRRTFLRGRVAFMLI
jgi:hypothetical protein